MLWWTLQQLKLQLMFGNPEIRVRAARKLGEIKDPRTVKPLIAALKDSNCTVRLAATAVLGKIGNARTVEPLVAALKDDDWDVREVAARALGEIGDERAVEPLITALKAAIPSLEKVLKCDDSTVNSAWAGVIGEEISGELGNRDFFERFFERLMEGCGSFRTTATFFVFNGLAEFAGT